MTMVVLFYLAFVSLTLSEISQNEVASAALKNVLNNQTVKPLYGVSGVPLSVAKTRKATTSSGAISYSFPVTSTIISEILRRPRNFSELLWRKAKSKQQQATTTSPLYGSSKFQTASETKEPEGKSDFRSSWFQTTKESNISLPERSNISLPERKDDSAFLNGDFRDSAFLNGDFRDDNTTSERKSENATATAIADGNAKDVNASIFPVENHDHEFSFFGFKSHDHGIKYLIASHIAVGLVLILSFAAQCRTLLYARSIAAAASHHKDKNGHLNGLNGLNVFALSRKRRMNCIC